MSKGYTGDGEILLGGNQKTQIVDSSGNAAVVSDDGQLHVVMEGKQDGNNSTTTPLGVDGVFTGTATNLLPYSAITLLVTSDQDSADNGLMVQFSSDGVTWRDGEAYTILANAQKFFTPPVQAAYYRIIYTNGPVAQTSFEIEAVLKKQPIKWSSHNIEDPIKDEDDAEVVKAVITGKNPTGTFQNVNTTVDGDLTISDNSSGFSIAKGNVTGHSAIQKFGNAPDFDSADGQVTVWDGAEDGTAWELMNYQYSTTADIDSISSSNGADTQEIAVQGLDANYELVEQIATLNGQTRVALTTPLIRVFRAYNNNSTDLAGHVVVYVNTALTGGVPIDKTKIRAIIDPMNQQTEMAVYTIPAGKTGYLIRGYASTSGASKTSNYVIRFFSREIGKVFRLQNVNAITENGNSIIVLDYFVPLRIPEKTDLEVRVEATGTGVTGAAVSAGFDLVLVDN